MKRRVLVSILMFVALCVPSVISGAVLKPPPRAGLISRRRAESIARRQAPGRVLSRELEREHGKLVYSFDIRNQQGTITEVLIDARTGHVISVKEESVQQEAQEKARERRKRRNGDPATERR